MLTNTHSRGVSDSGAEVNVGGTCHLRALRIDAGKLIPCTKRIVAVGGTRLTCRGWVPVDFSIGEGTTHQPLYIVTKFLASISAGKDAQI